MPYLRKNAQTEFQTDVILKQNSIITILKTLANQHTNQLIFTSSYQNKVSLAIFTLEANQSEKFVDRCHLCPKIK